VARLHPPAEPQRDQDRGKVRLLQPGLDSSPRSFVGWVVGQDLDWLWTALASRAVSVGGVAGAERCGCCDHPVRGGDDVLGEIDQPAPGRLR
jgi:hypothetical protein